MRELQNGSEDIDFGVEVPRFPGPGFPRPVRIRIDLSSSEARPNRATRPSEKYT